MEDRKFKFVFRIITTDEVIIDQNVFAFTFINYGQTDVYLNNQLLIPPAQPGQNPNSYTENLGSGEKTATGYKIKFISAIGKKQILQMIQKVLVQ